MKTRNILNTIQIAGMVLLAGGMFILSSQTTEAATTTCVFDRDLQLGVTGDDVKCLQKYLNANGFPIAASGVGSVGHETGEYKTLTEAAVIKWQKANKLVPAIGYFGAQSRLAFKKGGAVASTEGTSAVNAPLLPADSSDPNAALLAQVEALKAVLEGRATSLPTASAAGTVSGTITTPAASASDTTVANDASVRKLLAAVLTLVTKAESAIKKNSKASGINDAKDSLDNAKDAIFDALRSYVSGDYAAATTDLGKAKREATDAVSEANAASLQERAEKAYDTAESNYNDAEDEISQADDDGEDVTAAKKLLKKAANALDDAQTALDDEEYEDAIDAADEADGLISDALDEL